MSDGYLFACGTFRETEVQLQVFGRQLSGLPDTIVGFARHPHVRHTGNPEDGIEGMTYRVSKAELEISDTHEPPDYRRIVVTTEAGLQAWLYLKAVENARP